MKSINVKVYCNIGGDGNFKLVLIFSKFVAFFHALACCFLIPVFFKFLLQHILLTVGFLRLFLIHLNLCLIQNYASVCYVTGISFVEVPPPLSDLHLTWLTKLIERVAVGSKKGNLIELRSLLGGLSVAPVAALVCLFGSRIYCSM